MLRRGSAGSNTAAGHTALTDAAIAALPPGFRRKLMITVDGAGASHELIKHLDKLAARPGYQVIYSVGWALTERERISHTAARSVVALRDGVRRLRSSCPAPAHTPQPSPLSH
jgi:hypothetical protein